MVSYFHVNTHFYLLLTHSGLYSELFQGNSFKVLLLQGSYAKC